MSVGLTALYRKLNGACKYWIVRRLCGNLASLPSNRFEALLGERKGQYSIRINQQWRICFEWCLDGPHNVEIVDYY